MRARAAMGSGLLEMRAGNGEIQVWRGEEHRDEAEPLGEPFHFYGEDRPEDEGDGNRGRSWSCGGAVGQRGSPDRTRGGDSRGAIMCGSLPVPFLFYGEGDLQGESMSSGSEGLIAPASPDRAPVDSRAFQSAGQRPQSRAVGSSDRRFPRLGPSDHDYHRPTPHADFVDPVLREEGSSYEDGGGAIDPGALGQSYDQSSSVPLSVPFAQPNSALQAFREEQRHQSHQKLFPGQATIFEMQFAAAPRVQAPDLFAAFGRGSQQNQRPGRGRPGEEDHQNNPFPLPDGVSSSSGNNGSGEGGRGTASDGGLNGTSASSSLLFGQGNALQNFRRLSGSSTIGVAFPPGFQRIIYPLSASSSGAASSSSSVLFYPPGAPPEAGVIGVKSSSSGVPGLAGGTGTRPSAKSPPRAVSSASSASSGSGAASALKKAAASPKRGSVSAGSSGARSASPPPSSRGATPSPKTGGKTAGVHRAVVSGVKAAKTALGSAAKTAPGAAARGPGAGGTAARRASSGAASGSLSPLGSTSSSPSRKAVQKFVSTANRKAASSKRSVDLDLRSDSSGRSGLSSLRNRPRNGGFMEATASSSAKKREKSEAAGEMLRRKPKLDPANLAALGSGSSSGSLLRSGSVGSLGAGGSKSSHSAGGAALKRAASIAVDGDGAGKKRSASSGLKRKSAPTITETAKETITSKPKSAFTDPLKKSDRQLPYEPDPNDPFGLKQSHLFPKFAKHLSSLICTGDRLIFDALQRLLPANTTTTSLYCLLRSDKTLGDFCHRYLYFTADISLPKKLLSALSPNKDAKMRPLPGSLPLLIALPNLRGPDGKFLVPGYSRMLVDKRKRDRAAAAIEVGR